MCGIVGFSGKMNRETMYKVLVESSVRGLHSFGYSYYDKILTTKKFLDFDDAINSLFSDYPSLFIWHNRYSTSGVVDLDNAQPIHKGNLSLALNGVISGDSKEDMESQFGFTLITENDAEVLVSKIDDIKDFSKGKTIAAVWLKDGKLFAFRNNFRPLYLHKENDSNIFYSTSDIGKRSGLDGLLIASNEIYEI